MNKTVRRRSWIAGTAFVLIAQAASATEYADLKGFWGNVVAACDMSDSTFMITNEGASPYEATCTIDKQTREGNVFILEQSCEGEGETWTQTNTFELKSAKLLIVDGEGKYRRCPNPGYPE